MKILANKQIRKLFCEIGWILAGCLILAEIPALSFYPELCGWILLFFLLAGGALMVPVVLYFQRQNQEMEVAVRTIQSFLDGNRKARIPCNEEGELYHLFHTVNTVVSVLDAHAETEIQEKEFLKNTISDISHQLKTPLAALNIYNGLMQGEAGENTQIQEFAALSERELDRMETLVKNLLKLTRLDAGAVQYEKKRENLANMMLEIQERFIWRARQEDKELDVKGDPQTQLFCDRDWMMEAISNLVKNAFDHTRKGQRICVTRRQTATLLQIKITDNGCGIHPEDLLHIFKRFYRSRFSKDTEGCGLGLPLAKAIIEGHDGYIEVDSELEMGTVFTLNFLRNGEAAI